MPNSRDEFDSPWKQILEDYFSDFMAFFFPSIHQDIDWNSGYEFLDTELQKVVRDAELGKRFADKLVKVWKISGDELWVFTHIEIQQSREANFAERMFTYNYRLRDRHGKSIASLAVLTDDQQSWRPQEFQTEIWGCKTRFRFPMVKLIDYEQQWSSLEQSSNPFATVVMAHLKTMETRDNATDRKDWKLNISQQLYSKGLKRQDVLNLFQFIDWVMTLPTNLAVEFQSDLEKFERERQMQYVTDIERRALKKGRIEGALEAISLGLELKFGPASLRLIPAISQIQDLTILKAIQDGLREDKTLEEIKTIYENE